MPINITTELARLTALGTTEENASDPERAQTIRELSSCFNPPTDHAILHENLKEALATRWKRIKESANAYTATPFNDLNQYCAELARQLAPPIDGNEYADNEVGYLQVLMPGLSRANTVSGENLNNLSFYQFILSDDYSRAIVLEDVILSAAGSSDLLFKHNHAPMGDTYPTLSDAEIARARAHSASCANAIDAILAVNERKNIGGTLATELLKLAEALSNGGFATAERRREARANEEMAIGAQAINGMTKFDEFWKNLAPGIRNNYIANYTIYDYAAIPIRGVFPATAGLQFIIERLYTDKHLSADGSRTCIDMIAADIRAFVRTLPANSDPALSNAEQQMDGYCGLFNSNITNLEVYRNLHTPPTNLTPPALAPAFRKLKAAAEAVVTYIQNIENGLAELQNQINKLQPKAKATAHTLHTNLSAELEKFRDNPSANFENFKNTAKTSITTVQAKLDNDVELMQILQNLLIAVLGIGIPHIINKCMTGGWLFFKPDISALNGGVSDISNAIDRSPAQLSSLRA